MELEPMDLENYDEYLVKYVLLEKTKNRKYLETLKDEKFREDVINNMLKVFDVRAEIIEAIIGNILAKNQLSIERILWLAKTLFYQKQPEKREQFEDELNEILVTHKHFFGTHGDFEEELAKYLMKQCIKKLNS